MYNHENISQWKFVYKSMLKSIMSFSSFYWITFFMNLFEDFSKFFKCCLSDKNSSKYTENICEQWDISETNNWIRFLIFDDKS